MSDGSVYLLGLDPGFRNIGYSVIRVGSCGSQLEAAGIFHTEKSDKKRKILATEDNLNRAKEISKFLNSLMDKWVVSAICAEAMSFPPNASAAAKMAMCWGVISCISQVRKRPIVQASPQEIKLSVCGSKSASKEDVQSAVEKSYPVASFLTGVAKSTHEHAYDATASIMASLGSDLIQLLIERP